MKSYSEAKFSCYIRLHKKKYAKVPWALIQFGLLLDEFMVLLSLKEHLGDICAAVVASHLLRCNFSCFTISKNISIVSSDFLLMNQ